MLVLHQLLAGRDFARQSSGAERMANFVYLVGDQASGEVMLIDPAWDVPGLLEAARERGLRVVGAVATHGHADHIGGSLFGTPVEGAARLVAQAGVKIWCHEAEADRLLAKAGLAEADLVRTREGDRIPIGQLALEVLHTPGHTPGGQCLLVEGNLFTGDTLFVDECGRVDLPGSDPDKMWESLCRLAALPEQTVVWPGHHYGLTMHTTIGEQRRTNPCLQHRTLDDWRRALERG